MSKRDCSAQTTISNCHYREQITISNLWNQSMKPFTWHTKVKCCWRKHCGSILFWIFLTRCYPTFNESPNCTTWPTPSEKLLRCFFIITATTQSCKIILKLWGFRFVCLSNYHDVVACILESMLLSEIKAELTQTYNLRTLPTSCALYVYVISKAHELII